VAVANPRTGKPYHQEEVQHVSIQTTMNVYGRAMTYSKRQAHSNAVQMVLNGPAKKELDKRQEEPVSKVV
jgi:hypothetical protein